MTIDDEDEEDAKEGEYCEGARRILRVIASASLACLMEIVLQSSAHSSRGKRGGKRAARGMIGDGTTLESQKEEGGLGSSHPRARIYFGTLSMIYMEEADVPY